MSTLTPEHLQLLSDKKLEAAVASSDLDGNRALARAARYELKRRQCEIPVSDRYSSKPILAAS